MHQDCDRCGVFSKCDKHGICVDCRFEEQDEQEREEKTEETQEDED